MIYTVQLYGDFDMLYTAFVGDRDKAETFIDKLPHEKSYQLWEWKLNSEKHIVVRSWSGRT